MEHSDRVVKTSLYIPADVLAKVAQEAVRRGTSSAALIRSVVANAVDAYRPAPVGGFLSSRAAHRNTPEAREEYD